MFLRACYSSGRPLSYYLVVSVLIISLIAVCRAHRFAYPRENGAGRDKPRRCALPRERRSVAAGFNATRDCSDHIYCRYQAEFFSSHALLRRDSTETKSHPGHFFAAAECLLPPPPQPELSQFEG